MAGKKKILIVGGNGFVGSWLANSLSRNYNVTTFDINKLFSPLPRKRAEKLFNFRKKFLLKGCKKVQGDVRNFSEVKKVLEKEKPKIIVHLASIPIENFRDEKKQLETEVMGTFNVLRANKEIGARLVYMSSLFAVGNFDYAITENVPLNPQTNYGLGKAAGEFLVKSTAPDYGIIRTTSVYGFGDVNLRVPQIVLESSISQKNFWVNKSALLDFIYVKDLVEGIKEVAFHNGNEIFNISGGKARNLLEFTNAVEMIRNKKMTYEIRELNDRTRRGTLINEKARLILRWEPKYTLEDGIRETLKFYEDFPNILG